LEATTVAGAAGKNLRVAAMDSFTGRLAVADQAAAEPAR